MPALRRPPHHLGQQMVLVLDALQPGGVVADAVDLAPHVLQRRFGMQVAGYVTGSTRLAMLIDVSRCLMQCGRKLLHPLGARHEHAKAVLKTGYRDSTKRNMPRGWFDKLPHTHVALDDAIEQGALFCNMLRANQAA